MIPANHSIEVLKSQGLDIWGDPIEEVPVEVMGNLRSQTKTVRDNNGKEVVSNYQILFIGYVEVKPEDKIRFEEPNGQKVEQAPLLIKYMRDLDGSVGFTKVVL